MVVGLGPVFWLALSLLSVQRPRLGSHPDFRVGHSFLSGFRPVTSLCSLSLLVCFASCFANSLPPELSFGCGFTSGLYPVVGLGLWRPARFLGHVLRFALSLSKRLWTLRIWRLCFLRSMDYADFS